MNHPLATIVNAAGTYASRMMDYVSEQAHGYARRGIATTAVLGMLAAPLAGRAHEPVVHDEILPTIDGQQCLYVTTIVVLSTKGALHCGTGGQTILQFVDDALLKKGYPGYPVKRYPSNILLVGMDENTGMPSIPRRGLGACYPMADGTCKAKPRPAELYLTHHAEGERCDYVRVFIHHPYYTNPLFSSTIELSGQNGSPVPPTSVETLLDELIPPSCEKLIKEKREHDVSSSVGSLSDRERIELLEGQMGCVTGYLKEKIRIPQVPFNRDIVTCLKKEREKLNKPKSPSQ